MKKISILLIVTIIILAGFLAWYFLGQKQLEKYTGPVEKVTVAAYPDYAPFVYLAKEKGFFQEAGLDVDIKTFESGRLAMNALENGEADIATAADFVFVSDSFIKNDIRIFSTVTVSNNTHELIIRKDRGIEKIADIKGKKVGVTKKSSGEFFLGKLLIENGINLADIELVNLQPSEIVSALEKGEIDIALTWEPTVFKLKKSLGQNIMSFPAQGSQDSYFLLISTQGFISGNPDVLKRFLTAMAVTEEFVKANPAEVEMFISDAFRYEPEYMTLVWRKFNASGELSQALLLNMEAQARWAIKNKLTDKTVVPNYLDYIYMDALEKVKPEAVTIIR
ncbi:MAG: NrtA/SsuA/CpmA family ABC transporter substrate-binding protein [bacterium]|nr:NrtA/SsuA/CpmA family ABC transporter substrate-binding protein [bacterium]